MKNKIALLFASASLILSACGPSVSVIQTAMAQTQAALPTETPTPALTPTEKPSSTETTEPSAISYLLMISGTPVTVSTISPENAGQLDLLTKIEVGRGVKEIIFSPSGKLMAVIRMNGTVQIMDIVNSELINSLKIPEAISATLFNEKNLIIATCGDSQCYSDAGSKILSWEISSQSIQDQGEHQDVVIALSRDQKAILRSFMGWSTAIQLSGDRIWIKSKKYQYYLWDLSGETPTELAFLAETTNSHPPVAFLDGSKLAFESFIFQDTSVGEANRIWAGNGSSVQSLAFSPDGTLLASGWGDNRIRLWRMPAGILLKVLEGHNGAVNDLSFSPDGLLLASAASDRSVRIWRVSDGTLLRTLEGHTINVMAVNFSPNGALLVSIGLDDSDVRVWGIR